ncbi:Bacteriophage lambda head decoration protein D [Roseomonas rosea]|uniref:Bacteriophage lambda head decoration protein D n=1 Tax=Muricoccus roseus TaxID=198092 RepID=A0A1M6LCT6_9PROT|nr:head decoration protein [Roseomonas rosea]SHJ68968.1 Bacteriophage lambda head decoration protein D [Roseomonas rosea]
MPTAPVLSEGFYPGHFLVSQANGFRSRDTITIANTTGAPVTLQAGLVLAKLTANGNYVPYDNAGSDGSEVAAAILFATVTVPANGTKRGAGVTRAAEVNASELLWDASVDAAGKTAGLADLLALGIVAR